MVAISVIMSVFNTPVTILKEAVESILNQTFQDFEFIIIDDCSTGDSQAYLHTLSDPRIRILRNEANKGLTKSLNIGLRAAKGKYIARMDSDDISFPERFEKQFAFMEKNPDVIACGSKIISVNNKASSAKGKMEDMESYRVRMLFGNPGPNHSTAFINHEKLRQYHLEYDESLVYAQDYGLWAAISQHGEICVLPEALVYYRVHPNQISQTKREKQIQCTKMTQRKLLTQLLGSVTDSELDLHFSYSAVYVRGYYPDLKITPQASQWYDRLVAANHSRHIYNESKLKYCITLIKIKLLKQTFTNEMTLFDKISLFLHFVSFGDMLRVAINRIGKKMRSILP